MVKRVAGLGRRVRVRGRVCVPWLGRWIYSALTFVIRVVFLRFV